MTALPLPANEAERLVALAERQRASTDVLDDYVEAHVHGPLTLSEDVEALVQDVGFAPKTPIETGVAHFVEWYRSYYNIGD